MTQSQPAPDSKHRDEPPSLSVLRYADAEFLAEIGTWIYDPTTGSEQWSPGLAAVLNVPRDLAEPKLFEFLPSLESGFFRFLENRLPFYRKRFLHRTIADTSELLFQAEKRFDSLKNVSEVVATVQNVSDIVWSMGVSEIDEQILKAITTGEDVIATAVDSRLVMTHFEGEGWSKLRIDTQKQVGKRLDQVIEDYPDIIAAFRDSLRGRPQNTRLTFRNRHYLVKIRPYNNAEGAIAGALCLAVDVTERNVYLENLERGKVRLEQTVQRRTEQLRSSHAVLQTVLEMSQVGVIMTDGDGRITFVNPALTRMLGFGEEELVDRPLQAIFPEEIVREMLRSCGSKARIPEDGAHFHRQILLPRRDDRKIWVDVDAALSCNAQGEPERMMIDLLDVTEQRRRLEELETARQTSEAASEAKTRFLAHMSHEIRTPLNGVIGLSDLLMGTTLTNKQREYAGLINISGKSLLFLLNDILDFSKIEAGKMELEEEVFDLATTVESVLGILATRASDKGLELCGSFSPDLPRYVRGDSGRLRQVLINLVGNALKFTTRGGVKVQVATEQTTLARTPCDPDALNDEIRVRFSVVDTGIGIPGSEMPKLFHSFSQIDNAAARRHDGSGLGLAISKRLVELMQGELHVSSVENEGSAFWFTLPLACRIEIKDCPAHNRPDDEVKHFCPRMNIDRCPLGRRLVTHGSVPLSDRSAIVVDDNAVQRDTLAEQLTSWGMDVSKAASKSQAMDMLREAARIGLPFQLAIIDSSLEDGEGMDLVEAMKGDPALEETAIILLTPLTVDTDIAVIHSTGVSMHVSKPVFSSSLFDATITALFSKEKNKEAAPPVDETTEAIGEGFDSRRGLIRILVAEDNRINQIVVRDTLESVGFQCHVVENGRLAVEALQAEHFDAVLMDCQMPEMDGFEATARIREWETGEIRDGRHRARIPIIALTANATRDDEQLCLRSGMDAYCSKPINPKTLVRTLDQRTFAILQEKLESGPDLPRPPFQAKHFLLHCGNNRLIATMVLNDFLNQVPRDLEAIERAIQETRHKAAAPVLQHLRGKAGLLGATSLEKSAFELEEHCHLEEGSRFEHLLDILFEEADRCIRYAQDARDKLTEGNSTP